MISRRAALHRTQKKCRGPLATKGLLPPDCCGSRLKEHYSLNSTCGAGSNGLVRKANEKRYG